MFLRRRPAEASTSHPRLPDTKPPYRRAIMTTLITVTTTPTTFAAFLVDVIPPTVAAWWGESEDARKGVRQASPQWSGLLFYCHHTCVMCNLQMMVVE
jgi:hypothetical protein